MLDNKGVFWLRGGAPGDSWWLGRVRLAFKDQEKDFCVVVPASARVGGFFSQDASVGCFLMFNGRVSYNIMIDFYFENEWTDWLAQLWKIFLSIAMHWSREISWSFLKVVIRVSENRWCEVPRPVFLPPNAGELMPLSLSILVVQWNGWRPNEMKCS